MGKTAHEDYIKWMTSSTKGSTHGKQQANVPDMQSLKQTVVQEQIACRKVLESLTHEKRRGLYVQFCPAVPQFINMFLRNRIVDQLTDLPAVYIRETDFDCNQMLVKYGNKIACKLNHFISKPRQSFPAESADIGGFLLTQKSFDGHPRIVSKKSQKFQDLESSLSQLAPWEKEEVSSYVEKLGPFLSDDHTSSSTYGSSGSNVVCLASFDTLVVLACCLFLNDVDVIIPFSKRTRHQSSKDIILQFKEPLYLYGMPQRFHFRKIYKALLDNHHFSCLSKSQRKTNAWQSATSNSDARQGINSGESSSPMTDFQQRTEDPSADNSMKRSMEPLITLHDLLSNSDAKSSKPSLIICHHSAIMLKTNAHHNESSEHNITSSHQSYEIDGSERLVFHVLKLEMQPEFGLEELAIDELVRIALLFALHPDCKVVLTRVGYDGRSIIDVTDFEEREFKPLCSSKYNLDIQVCLSKLSQLVTKLSKLETDAEYCLKSTVNSTKCDVFIQSSLSTAPDITQRPSLNMLQFFNSQPTLQCAQVFAWTPIDVNKLTPFHWKTMHIPCTFPIGQPLRRGRSGPNNNGDRNPGSSTSGFHGNDLEGQRQKRPTSQHMHKLQNGVGGTSKKKNKKNRLRGGNKGQQSATSW